MRRKGKFLMSLSQGAIAVTTGFSLAGTISATLYAAPLSPVSGTNSVTGADTIDASSENGATDADISFNLGNVGPDNLTLTITGAGTLNLGSVSIINGDNIGDTTDMLIGNGIVDTTVIFNGIVNGDETGGVATNGDLDILISSLNAASGNTTVRFLSSVNLGQNGTLTVNSDADGTSTLVINGTISAQAATLGSNSALTLGSGLTNGSTALQISGTVTDGANITINPDPSFSSGTITIIDSTGSTLTLSNYSLSSSVSILTNYQLSLADGTADLILTASQSTSGELADSLGTTTAAVDALVQGTAATTGDTTVATAYTNANTTGGAAAELAAEQSQNQPDVLTAVQSILASTGTRLFSIGSDRLALNRSEDHYASSDPGLAFSGNSMSKDNGFWLRPFVSYGDQETKDRIDGYTAVTYGMAGGLDRRVSQNSSLGAAFSYARSRISGNGAGNADTDVDSYQITVYGDYSTREGYIEAMLGYAYNDIGSTRKFTFGGLDRRASADYDSHQFMARIGGGIPIALDNSFFLTPQGSLQYTHINTSDYTETGAGVLNLSVNPDSSNILLAMAGAKLHSDIKRGSGVFSPQLHANLMYDFIGDTARSTSTFTSGGTAFEVEGSDIDQFGVNFGAGFTYTVDNMEISAIYDAEVRESFTGHAGRVEFRVNF